MKGLKIMSLKRLGLLVSLVLLSCGSALAWNCSDPLASRVDVGPVNPGGSAGDGDGQWFLGTGSEGVKGDYYVCQVPKKTTGGGGSTTTNTNTNTNQNSNTQGQQQGQQQGQTANGGSATSTATGGNATGGNATATGGAGGAGDSVSGSRNSNVKNTNNVNTTVAPV